MSGTSSMFKSSMQSLGMAIQFGSKACLASKFAKQPLVDLLSMKKRNGYEYRFWKYLSSAFKDLGNDKIRSTWSKFKKANEGAATVKAPAKKRELALAEKSAPEFSTEGGEKGVELSKYESGMKAPAFGAAKGQETFPLAAGKLAITLLLAVVVFFMN